MKRASPNRAHLPQELGKTSGPPVHSRRRTHAQPTRQLGRVRHARVDSDDRDPS